MELENAPQGYERLAEVLAQAGVRKAFGVPGVHNLPMWTSFAEHGIQIIGVRHEQTAAYAADGYARATGNLGVALVTTGPGAGNAVTGTGEAFTVGSPILVIATDIATTTRRPGVFRGALHECQDQTGMFAPVTKATFVADDADRVGDVAKKAIRAALSAPTGPVYLGLPIDTLDAPAPTPVTPLQLSQPTHVESAETLEQVAHEISRADNVLVWAGGGAVASRCGDSLTALVERAGAAFVSTYAGKGLVPFDHPLVVTAPPQMPEVEQLWNDADVVVVVGSDLDAMMTRSWLIGQPKRLIAINIDHDDASKNYPADITLVGDAEAVLRDLLPLIEPSNELKRVQDEVASVNERAWNVARDESAEAVEFLDTLAHKIDPKTNLVLDMCVAGYWVGGFARVRKPRKVAYPIGWGTLGFALPASIGTASTDTGPTVVVVGDGGFMYATGELATIVQESLPITIVVVDDQAYGMLRFAQDVRGLPNLGISLHTPNFSKLAESFGIASTQVTGLGSDFAKALEVAMDSGAPHLIWAQTVLFPPPTTSTRAERVAASSEN